MTRFQIAIISDEGIKTSTEFNGGGYWDGYGKDVYEALQDIGSVQEWKDYVTKFNSETFGYFERLHYNVPDDYLDMVKDYYDKNGIAYDCSVFPSCDSCDHCHH